MRVNAVAYFKIVDPKNAIVQVENYMSATSQISQTTLRSVLGQHVLDELLSEREKINEILQEIIDEATGPWGIKVSIVEVKDVEIPTGMQKAMARQAEAERERRAKIISSEGEFQAAEKLKDAAIVLEEHPVALQLRYLQTLIEVERHTVDDDRLPRPDRHHPAVPRARREELIVRAAPAARSASRRAARTPGAHPRGRAGSRASRARSAPSMSSAIMSPTITASAGSTSSRSRTARKIDACGFVRPWWKELMPASTSSPWWRANSRTSRAEFETRPMRRPAERSAVEHVRHVVVELEVLVPLPGARDLDGAGVRRVCVPAHAAHDPLGEAEPDLVVVLELGVAAEIDESGVAGRLVAARLEPEPVALAGADVALRPELRPRPREREVDVEEDCAEHRSLPYGPVSGCGAAW